MWAVRLCGHFMGLLVLEFAGLSLGLVSLRQTLNDEDSFVGKIGGGRRGFSRVNGVLKIKKILGISNLKKGNPSLSMEVGRAHAAPPCHPHLPSQSDFIRPFGCELMTHD